MKISIWIMIVNVLFYVIGSIIIIVTGNETLFANPLSVLLFAAIACANMVCVFKRKLRLKNLKNIGFLLCHIGVVILLIGACMGHFLSDRVFFSLPIDDSTYYGQLPRKDGSMVELDFGLNISGFWVERYDPGYALYKPDSENHGEFTFVTSVKKQLDNTYDMGDLGKIKVDLLKDHLSPDGFVDQYPLDNNWLLVKMPATDKHYLAKLNVMDKEGHTRTNDLKVNAPVDYKGWRFYLMSYDRQFGQYVVLSGRYDPGRYFVIYGIWITIIGTALLCFIKGKKEVREV